MPPDAVLLAALAFYGDQQRDEMARLLSPGADRPGANANLRQRIFRLRRACGHGMVDFGPTLHLLDEVAADIGAAKDEAAVDFGSQEFFGSLVFPPSRRGLAAWVERTRSDWRARRRGCLAALAECRAASGDLPSAIATMDRAVVEDPLREDRVRRLMIWQAQMGDRSAAALSFARCEQALVAHGRGVGRETAELATQIERSGPLPLQGPALPASLRGVTPFVGRAEQMRSMASAWEQGRVFVLIGDAGIGKTRLLAEFSGLHRGVLQIVADAGGSAHGTTLRWLRECNDRFGSPAEPRHRAELSRLLPELGQPPAAPAHEALLHAALHAALVLARESGLFALVIDDLHRVDEASLAALARCAESPTGPRFGFAMRPLPDGEQRLDRLMSIGTLPLPVPVGGFESADIEALIQRMDLQGLTDDHRADKLRRHCGGNPYFLLETLRELAQRGGWQEPLPVPASAEALIAQRLRFLPPAALALARLAAVAGPDFNDRMAAAAASAGPADLAHAWQSLQTAHVFDDRGFAHDIALESVRHAIPSPESKALHASVAAWLAGRDAPPERIAHHHASACEWAQAAAASERAAARVLRFGQHGAAIGHLDNAARWHDCAGLPRQAHRAGAAALLASLMQEGAAAAAARADRLFATAADSRERAEIEAERGRIAIWAGDTREAERASRAVLAVDTATPQARALAQAALTVALGWQSRTAEALAVIEPIVVNVDAIEEPDLRQGMWSAYGFVLTNDERWSRGEEVLKNALSEALRNGDPAEEADARANLGAACWGQGKVQEAIVWARTAMELYAVIGNPLGQRNNELNLASFLAGAAEFAEAISLLERVIEFGAGEASASIYRFTAEDILAEVWLSLGRFDRAQALLTEEAPTQPPVRQLVRSELRARLATTLGNPDAARLWDEALTAVDRPSTNRTRQLRTRLNVTVTMPPADALAACERLLAEARRLQSPVIEMLGLMRSAQARIRLGAAAAGRSAIDLALDIAGQRQHLFVPRTELLWTAAQVLQAADLGERADACLAEGRRWLLHVAGYHVPLDCRIAFLEDQPIHRMLMSGAPNPLRGEREV